jgi:hypothetical protein
MDIHYDIEGAGMLANFENVHFDTKTYMTAQRLDEIAVKQTSSNPNELSSFSEARLLDVMMYKFATDNTLFAASFFEYSAM